jgi:deoxyribodipyrimidine photo-lyase
MKDAVTIFWFRRDLRLEDNAGLYHALKSNTPVLPVFIFDRHILDQLENKTDRRVAFIHAALTGLQEELRRLGSCLEVHDGYPPDIFRHLMSRYRIDKVFTNHDYEPYARKRDLEISELLGEEGISFFSFKDQVIFEKGEVLKDDGKPYTVFTPYSKKWKATLNDYYLAAYPVEKYASNFYRPPIAGGGDTGDGIAGAIPSLKSIGFQPVEGGFPPRAVKEEILKKYKTRRDYPAIPEGTSHMGVHLRFGTCSIRELVRLAGRLSETYLNELIWRDFYQMILWHFPAVGEGRSFKPAYDRIEWRNNETEFERWCNGMTGYPIVDAGMRELNQTGFMHNRVRMIVASFLTKHLLIDWRWGEAWFAEKLLDYDLAANNGGWQWAAGSGCDAAPYFRVFNPYLQTEKFDPDRKYIRQWVPEWEDSGYPPPIIAHELARKRALEVYGKALKEDR